ncbi:MAG: hypothetical protein K5891_04550 [Lachnospiraceae bacterium]|nr:hypothetical protein [Lachnospiraceae bacterium]
MSLRSVSTYEDYKYYIQDVSRIYVGCKFTLGEIMDNEEITYKFRKVVAESILPHADREDTLETVLYYLERENFALQVFKQMNAKVRVSVLREKKHLLKKSADREYVTELMDMDTLVGMTPEEKQAAGLFLQELQVSKLALATC